MMKNKKGLRIGVMAHKKGYQEKWGGGCYLRQVTYTIYNLNIFTKIVRKQYLEYSPTSNNICQNSVKLKKLNQRERVGREKERERMRKRKREGKRRLKVLKLAINAFGFSTAA